MSATVISPPEAHRAIRSCSRPPLTVPMGLAITVTVPAEATVAR
jgi:hypothetical protein